MSDQNECRIDELEADNQELRERCNKIKWAVECAKESVWKFEKQLANMTQNTEQTNGLSPEAVEAAEEAEQAQFIDECKGMAEHAGFRGLLLGYLSGHRPTDYGELLIGAQEIMTDILDRTDYDECEQCEHEDGCLCCFVRSVVFGGEDGERTKPWRESRFRNRSLT